MIRGSGNPLFVGEEVIAVGNALDRLGICKVTQDLVITEIFYMNFQSNP